MAKGAAVGIARIFGRRKAKAPWDEPYVHTSKNDGGKYIIPDEYMQLEKVRRQVNRLPDIVRSRQARQG